MYATLLLLQAPSGNSFFAPLALYVVIAAIFYFVLFRPQQAQRRAHDAAVKAIKRGDQVVTAGGIVGEVVHIREHTAGTASADDHVTIKSAESRLVVERGKIAKLATRGATTTSAPASSAGANAG
jgi:preprotein translocase subunit YajC